MAIRFVLSLCLCFSFLSYNSVCLSFFLSMRLSASNFSINNNTIFTKFVGCFIKLNWQDIYLKSKKNITDTVRENRMPFCTHIGDYEGFKSPNIYRSKKSLCSELKHDFISNKPFMCNSRFSR